VSDAWRRFGKLPATPFVAWYFALAILAGLTLGDDSTGVGLALTAVFIAYCIARTARGLDLFLAAACPNAAATLLHDIAGTPRWLAAILIPAVLLYARSIDREAAA
jgi:hypothetical protein